MKLIITFIIQWLALCVYSAPIYNLNKNQFEQIKTNTLINYAILEAAKAKLKPVYVDNSEENEDLPSNLSEFKPVETLLQNEAENLANKKSPAYFLNKRKADVIFLRRVPVKS